jgi:hypothetical protein
VQVRNDCRPIFGGVLILLSFLIVHLVFGYLFGLGGRWSVCLVPQVWLTILQPHDVTPVGAELLGNAGKIARIKHSWMFIARVVDLFFVIFAA